MLQFRLSPKSGQRQIWLEDPEVLDVTLTIRPLVRWQSYQQLGALLFGVKPVCANVGVTVLLNCPLVLRLTPGIWLQQLTSESSCSILPVSNKRSI